MNPLIARWRDQADAYERDGITGHAALLRRVALDLEAFERERALEALTLDEAAEESGYSYSALQKLVASGALANAGAKGSPRIRRGDVPRKLQPAQPEPVGGPDLVERIGRPVRRRGTSR